MTAAAAVGPTEPEELMEAQAQAAHEHEVGDATRLLSSYWASWWSMRPPLSSLKIRPIRARRII